MKYDPETTTIEFTVQVPVDWIPAIAECHDSNEASETWVPLAALMHLLETYKAGVPIVRALDMLKDHPGFDDALAGGGYFDRIAAE